MKYLVGAAFLLAVSVPALAQTTTSTTTTTGDYYIVRDPSTKKCTVTTSKPESSGTTVVVGDTVYKSQTEADTAVTKVCTE